jgi:hypothetical protein
MGRHHKRLTEKAANPAPNLDPYEKSSGVNVVSELPDFPFACVAPGVQFA